MKKTKLKKDDIVKLIKLYDRYRKLIGTSHHISPRQLPPLTLDEKLENINPYYVRNEHIKYG